MNWTESAISAALDGNFWRFNHETGRTENEPVPRNYIPNHFKAAHQQDAQRARADASRPWTPELDDKLLASHAKGFKWSYIAQHVGRGLERCRLRYEYLMEQANNGKT